jgi:choice-of-anchor B domain-containing protein
MGRLPTQTVSSIWRDMKVIDGYCYIGSEAAGHGLQVFDMRKLLKLKSPKTFDIATDLTAWHKGFGSSHNIVAHEQTKTIFAVGTTRSGPCKAGLYMLDVQNPAKPTYAGCASEDGYVHDAQCVIYSGPDAQYTGKEICFGYNEDSLTVYDVTDRKAPKVISSTPYTGSQYTHQGWIIDPVGQTFLLLDDELDEQESSGEAADQRTTTYIWNITSLATPVKTGIYKSPVKSIDHNQYVIDGISWQSNYASGLRVVDVSKFEEDPTGASFEQIAYFDCYPEDDASPEAEFYGAWSVYPYFKSGYVLLNSIERGIFSLKPTFQKPGKPGQGKDRGD